jgi:phosphomannomutase/phosphoglucomutase
MCRFPLLYALLTLAACGGGSQAVPGAQGGSERGEATPPEIASIADALARCVQGLREELRIQTVDGRVRDALRVQRPQDVAAAERSLRRILPQAIAVRVVGRDWMRLLPKAGPNLHLADIDMVRRAETTGHPLPVEVHRIGKPDAHVTLVEPVLDASGEVLGAIVAAWPWTLFRGPIDDAKYPLGLGLVQTVGGRDEVVIKGRSGLRPGVRTAALPVPGAAWKLTYWRAPPATSADRLAADFLGGALLLGGILFGVWIALRRRQRSREYVAWPRAGGDLNAPLTLDPAASGPNQALVDSEPRASEQPPGQPMADLDASPAEVSHGNGTRGAEVLEVLASDKPAASDGRVPASIFRAYDIRGVVGQSLTPSIVYEIGLAIGSEAQKLGERRIVVGRDGRLSGPGLVRALVNGLNTSGMEVLDIGMVPTPTLYYASEQLRIPSGVMVTGSHNPPNYNGLKIVLGGETLAEAGIQQLRQRIETRDLQSVAPVDGSSSSGPLGTDVGPLGSNVIAEYVGRVLDKVVMARPLRVVVDCGNGVAALVVPRLMRAMGCTVVELFCQVDGHFPNHHPDPSQPENLAALIEKVSSEGADLGLAFDGDGDRLGVVDDQGRIIWPDRQMMLYAADVLTRHPGATIIYDVKCTANLEGVIRNRGGHPLMWKTGHSLIKAKMRETGALLAGEMSGHIFFRDDWYGFDDAPYAAARLLQILGRQPHTPSAVFAALPDAVNTPEMRIEMTEGEHFAFMDRALATVAAEPDRWFPGSDITTIDGLRVDFKDRWGLVRASNTTPSLVLRFEAFKPEGLEQIEQTFGAFLQALDPSLRLPF